METQRFRLKSETSSAGISQDVEHIHIDKETGKDVIFWDDILQVYKHAVYVKHGDFIIPYEKDSITHYKLEPYRIRAYPDVILDVVVDNSLGHENYTAFDEDNGRIRSLNKRRESSQSLSSWSSQSQRSVPNTKATSLQPQFPRNLTEEEVKEKAKARPNESYELGCTYEKGSSVIKRNYSEALQWYQKAANRGHIAANTKIGLLYYHGKGVPQDYSRAIDYFLIAVDRRDPEAQYHLGKMYSLGHGIPVDYVKAAELFHSAASQKQADAQCSLGKLYESGQGVQKNPAEAIKYYINAAEHSVEAQYFLGQAYYKGVGVTENFGNAVDQYRKAANEGHAEAQNSLAFMYEQGKGIERDYATAARWYEKAAKQGNAAAQFHLGTLYRHGRGVKKDSATAIQWLSESGNGGYVHACLTLGNIYLEGEGVSRDYTETVKWYGKAADLGSEEGRRCLSNTEWYNPFVKLGFIL